MSTLPPLPPEPKSRWHPKNSPHGTVVKVMAVVDGWVMWRHKGAMPALRHVNQWHDGFEPAPPIEPKKKRDTAMKDHP